MARNAEPKYENFKAPIRRETGKSKPREMNRTSGVAGRRLGRSESIGFKLKYGAPLTGSASGVKSISLKDAGEVLTQGIVTLGKKGLKMDPASLAFALPFGKVFNAAKALRGAGKIAQATGLEARLGAKVAGSLRAGNLAERSGRTPVSELSKGTFEMGQRARKTSESVYPRGTDLARRALKAKSETGAAIRESMKYEFPFDRVVREADRIQRKYGLTQRTAEEGIRQAKKLKGK